MQLEIGIQVASEMLVRENRQVQVVVFDFERSARPVRNDVSDVGNTEGVLNLKKAFEPQRRKERKGKTMCYLNLPSHLIGGCQMDFMPLFCELGNKPPIPAYPISLRLRVFAVNKLRFLG